METELKLALVGGKAQELAEKLRRMPLLRRRKALRQRLRNIYFDDAEQTLQRQQAALRIRKIQAADGDANMISWRQTLKTGGGDSALSQRGEWESNIASGRLSLKALAGSPWPQIDPKGKVFAGLKPIFETSFERSLWALRRRGGTLIDLALDIGAIKAGERAASICEVELELRAGPVSALFEVAEQIAQVVAVLPMGASKAERGHALADARQDRARRSRPGAPAGARSLTVIAHHVLRESFGQFCANLEMLLRGDSPELAHQARVGWRRFRSAIRLFRPFLDLSKAPSRQPLHVLLTRLGELRDLDVARTETLPPLAQAFVAGSAERAQRWQAVQAALDQQAKLCLLALRAELGRAELGACLLETTRWIELAGILADNAKMPEAPEAPEAPESTPWARRKLARLHARMQDAAATAGDAELQHRARILAKRLRYGVEALRGLLTKRQGRRWHEQACALQARLGAERDLAQALQLVLSGRLDPGVADYLRGVEAGQVRAAAASARPAAE